MIFSKYKTNKNIVKGLRKKAGRNNQGKCTVRSQGGGNKTLYRTIDWSRKNENGVVVCFEYDPNRTAFLAKLQHNTKNLNEAYSYIIAPKGLKMFDTIQTIKERRRNLLLRPGDATILYNFESGDFIHNVELFPGSGAKIARAAGTSSQILQYASKNYAKIRLPSGSQRLISLNAMAVLGIIANENHNRIIIGKAGRNRWKNIRPSVRGVAMNPVDHPHGGGHGKTKGGRPSVTPWSKITKGQPTRNKKKKNKLILSTRKK